MAGDAGIGTQTYVRENGFGRVGRIPTPTGFSVGDINTYVVLPAAGSDALVLVDTGVRTDAAWDALERGLGEFGFAVEDLSLVILTHAHPDHCGQAMRIRQRAGCEVWIHEEAHRTLGRYDDPTEARRAIVEAQLASFGVPAEVRADGMGIGGSARGVDVVDPLEPDLLLKDGDRVEIPGFDLEVVHTPGHCPEEVVFWQPDSRVMFSGDHLLPEITPICLMNFPDEPGGERVSSLAQYQDSLDRAEALPARRAFPSHGDVIEDPRALIASYRLHTDKRKLQLSRQLAQGPGTVFELGQRMFRRVWREQLYLVLSEVIGHLDLLEREGRVAVQRGSDGVLRYSLCDGAPAEEEGP